MKPLKKGEKLLKDGACERFTRPQLEAMTAGAVCVWQIVAPEMWNEKYSKSKKVLRRRHRAGIAFLQKKYVSKVYHGRYVKVTKPLRCDKLVINLREGTFKLI